jgi:NAD(P)-dependent dehydrogenase (short-subunit alcohol dehydrogenase family)
LIQHLLMRENVIVFAGARDPTSATALNELANQHQGKLHVVKLLSADEANNRVVVENIKRIAGRLDVVIANAGILKNPSTVLATSQENMLQHFTVNVLGPMMLIQATHPLLKASTSTPKFVPISSASGSIAIGSGFPIPQVEYGTSKAALNWLTKKLWTENPELSAYISSVSSPYFLGIDDNKSAVTFPMHPGLVDTGLISTANAYPELAEMVKSLNLVPLAPEDSARMVLQQIDAATRETGFINEEGQGLPW